MNECIKCGSEITREIPLCLYHEHDFDDGWDVENHAYCDFLHRGIPLPPPAVRQDMTAMVP